MVVMPSRDSTCWTLVRGAAAGVPEDREDFVRRYAPVIRAYLGARWRLPSEHEEVADGSQEVFLQCFKAGGALERAEPGTSGGFRAFLYGIARNVASASERRRTRNRGELDDADVLPVVASEEATLSAVFDQAWARMIMREARELLERRTPEEGRAALGLQALRLRYESALPSREISAKMGIDAGVVYQLLTDARKEFRGALLEVMASYHPTASKGELERRCIDYLRTL